MKREGNGRHIFLEGAIMCLGRSQVVGNSEEFIRMTPAMTPSINQEGALTGLLLLPD